ncbi:hypothetical protein FOCC_FOCC016336 [Frankliniella occidentalis]|nr:hypothetical protein FOCC_FOCC016336 [Frankliniella occidentalis]
MGASPPDKRALPHSYCGGGEATEGWGKEAAGRAVLQEEELGQLHVLGVGVPQPATEGTLPNHHNPKLDRKDGRPHFPVTIRQERGPREEEVEDPIPANGHDATET